MGKLQRALGLTSLTFYGVGTIVGAGIYAVIGAAAGEAGRGLWLSFVLAAVAAGLTAVSYAELTSAIPKAGAEYVYLGRALPRRKWLAWMTGFLVALTGAATAATVAIAFAGYLRVFVPVPGVVAAGALLAACTALNLWGIRQSSWVNIVFTLIEVLGLVLIIGAGVRAPGFGEGALASISPAVLSGAALIFFVYTGFEGMANLAEEAKRPERDLPRALLISLGVTTVLYVLVGLSVVALAEPEALAGSDSPLAEAAGAVSSKLATALVWIALFSTANTGLISLIVASRLLFAMARNGDMPGTLARTLPGRKTPWVAALVLLAAAGALLPLGRVEVVASVSSFASLLAFAAVHTALIVLRYKEPALERPFRAPLAVGRLPVTPVLGLLCIAGLLTQFGWTVYATAAGAIVVAALVYATRRWWGRGEVTE